MLCEHVDSYLAQLGEALTRLDREAIWAVIEELMRAWRDRRQIFLCGNGGSAALATHMATDLNKTIVPGQPRLRAVSLADNVPLMTAIANDLTYEHIFAEQLRNLCRPGDVVIAVSGSGNSPNVLAGVRAAHELGATVVAFTGDTGGLLKDMADLCIFAPAGLIQQQEDVHLALDHLISKTLGRWIDEVARYMLRPARALVLAGPVGDRAGVESLPAAADRLSSLERTLTWLRHYGLHDVAVSMPGGGLTGGASAVCEYLGDGSAFGLRLRYLRGDAPAVEALDGFGEPGSLLVVNEASGAGESCGDAPAGLDLRSLLLFHYQNVARDAATGATLALSRANGRSCGGRVSLNGSGRIVHLRHGSFGPAGVSVLEPRALPHVESYALCDLEQAVYPHLLAAGVALYGWVLPQDDLRGGRASESVDGGPSRRERPARTGSMPE